MKQNCYAFCCPSFLDSVYVEAKLLPRKGCLAFLLGIIASALLGSASTAQNYYPGGLPASVINVWHDASDPSSLTYSTGITYASTGLTGSGTISTNTITTTATVSGLATGNIVRWGSNTVDYTVQSISGTTITLTSNLLATFSAQTINRKDSNLLSQWSDKSGKNMHAVQATVGSQPMLNTLNGKKIVEFNGTKLLGVADNDYLDPTTGYNLAQAIYVYSDAPTSVTDFRNGTYTRNNGGLNTNTPTIAVRYSTTDSKYETGLSQNNSGMMITSVADLRNQWSMVENYVTAGYNKAYVTLNAGTTVNNGIYTVTYTNNTNALTIGNRTTYPTAVHWGVSETVLTGSPIGNAGRKILESYLAWKWGMQSKLPSSLLNLFNPSNISFNNKLVGIGKEANGDSIVTTGSNDGLGFTNTSFLKDSGDYIIAAHNGLTGTGSIATDFTRSNRIWCLSKTDASNNGGLISLFFNFTSLGLTLDTTNNYYNILFNATDPTFATGTNSFITTNSFTQDGSGTQLSFSLDAANLSSGYYTVVYTPKATTTYTTTPYAPAGLAKSQYNLWFDASDTSTITVAGGLITKWVDKANGLQALPYGTGYNPVLNTQNGKYIVEFNGVKALSIADNPLLDPSTGYHLAQSVFVYSDAPTSVTDSRVGTYSRNTFGSNTPQIGIRYSTTDTKYELNLCRNNSFYNINTQPDLRNTWSLVQNYVPMGYANMYIALNGGATETDTASFIDFSSAASLGNRYTSAASVHWGIGETLLTGASVGNSGRKIIASYLAWKWGFQSNLFSGQLSLFNPSNTAFSNKLIGIGMDGITDSITTTATHEGLSIANGNGIAGFLREAGDYMMAAHNAATGTATIGTYFTRWNRAWFINKTDVNGFGGNVNLTFDFAEYGLNGLVDMLSKSYYILYNATDGSFASGNNYIIPVSSYQKNSGTNQISFLLEAANLSCGYYTIVYGGNEKPTSTIPFVTNFTAPTITIAPAPLLTNIVAGNTVNYINWNTDSIAYAVAYYKIYVSVNGGAKVLLDSVPATQKSYAHYNLTNGSSYAYTVTALYALGKESVVSNSLAGVPTVNTPTWAATPMYAGTGKVVMKAATAFANLPFKYYFEAVAGGGHTSGYMASNIYTDTGLTNGNTYSYHFKYQDSTKGVSTESGWSSTESVTLADSARGGFTYNLLYLDPTTIDAPNGIFPSIANPTQQDTTGLRFIKNAPAFGIHPRLYCNPDDTTDIKNRMLNTYSGRAISRIIHANTVLVQLGVSGYNRNAAYSKDTMGILILSNVGASDIKSYYDKLAVGDTTGYYNLWGGNNVKIAYQLSFEAYECWLYKGTTDVTTGTSYTNRAVKLAAAITTWARATLTDPNPANALSYDNRDRIGGYNMALIYDFLYPQMAASQRDTIRLVLSKITSRPSDLHAYQTPSYTFISNHATFGYEIYPNLAIEGETGYTTSADSGIKNWCRSTFNFLNNGIYTQTGNFYEAIGKDQINGALLVLLAKRGYSFLGHPSVRNYGKKFLPAITQPFGYSFVGADVLGGTSAYANTVYDPATGDFRFNNLDILGLKWSMPKDTAIDFVWRNYIQKPKANQPVVNNYYSYVTMNASPSYFNFNIPGAIFANDYFSMPFATESQAAYNSNKMYFDSLGGFAVMRSGFDSASATLFYHSRQDLGGHTLPNKGNIMYSALGRIWFQSPCTSNSSSQIAWVNTSNSFSGVLVNGYGQSSDSTSTSSSTSFHTPPSKMVDFKNTTGLQSIASDMKESFNYLWSQGVFPASIENPNLFVPGALKVTESQNSFRYSPGYFFDNFSFYNSLSYVTGMPYDQVYYNKTVKIPSPHIVQKAFRTVALVPASKPYVLLADDVQKDNTVNNYKWLGQLAKDLNISSTVVSLVDSNYRNDIIISEPSGTGSRKLLVRVLNNTGAVNPTVPGITDSFNILSTKRLILESNSVDAKFKVMLFAYNTGDALPKTKWNAAHDTLQVGFTDSVKTFAYKLDASGRTNIVLVNTLANTGFAAPATIARVLPDSLSSNAKPAFGVYPNPVAGGRANLQLSNINKGIYTVNIMSAAGILVKQITLRHEGGNARFPISLPYSKGIYLIELSGTKNRFSSKMLIE
ncbi:T9SS type A sorting domain-containing protein [Parasediminibacterium sp. JCM 36343]|uniref:T9SS type A sorting domain-containing protein n=1 Tax=Parasediminibacterium sp. JCM 36343 TaxID=3374279 RepID=UPI00397DF812